MKIHTIWSLSVKRLGSAKANGREPKSNTAKVLDFKLGCLIVVEIVRGLNKRSRLELKTLLWLTLVTEVCPWAGRCPFLISLASHTHRHLSDIDSA